MPLNVSLKSDEGRPVLTFEGKVDISLSQVSVTSAESCIRTWGSASFIFATSSGFSTPVLPC